MVYWICLGMLNFGTENWWFINYACIPCSLLYFLVKAPAILLSCRHAIFEIDIGYIGYCLQQRVVCARSVPFGSWMNNSHYEWTSQEKVMSEHVRDSLQKLTKQSWPIWLYCRIISCYIVAIVLFRRHERQLECILWDIHSTLWQFEWIREWFISQFYASLRMLEWRLYGT